jgi:hypothetical protein
VYSGRCINARDPFKAFDFSAEDGAPDILLAGVQIAPGDPGCRLVNLSDRTAGRPSSASSECSIR